MRTCGPLLTRGAIRLRIAGLAAVVFAAVAAPGAAQTELLWTFSDAEHPDGTLAHAGDAPANLTVSELSRRNGGGTLLSGSSASNYPGASGGFNAGTGAPGVEFNPDEGGSAAFEVTLTPAAGHRVSLTKIAFGSRSTATGPAAYSIRTSLDGFAADAVAGELPADSTWNPVSHPALSLESSDPLTIRIYGYGGTSTTLAVVWRIDDLALTVSVASEADPPPQIASFSPTSGPQGTEVTIHGANFGAAPTVSFNGTPAPGATANPGGTQISATVPAGATTGPLTVTGPGGAAVSASPFTVVLQPAISLVVIPNVFPENGSTTCELSLEQAPAATLNVELSSSDPTRATVPASVSVPAGETGATFSVTGVPDGMPGGNSAVTIAASAPGYDTGTAQVTVTNVDAQPTSVVVNKYLNNPDMIELLVIADNAAGSTLDMRGMILKDFSGSMGGDGGGRFRFNDVPLFAAVRAGTLIVVSAGAESADTDAGDFVLRLGAGDTAFFTNSGGSLDIATTEMVTIKAAGSDPAGTVGAIHSLAGGVEGSFFTEASPPKLLAVETSGTGLGVVANTATGSLADFNGDGATGAVPMTADDFGIPHNQSNNQLVRRLRGIVTLDGAGVATVSNTSAGSPPAGRGFFRRGQTDRTLTVSLVSDAEPGAIAAVRVTVPAEFGAPSAAAVSVTGAGAGTPTVVVSGQDVTVSGTAVTTEDAVAISIGGLQTPTPTGSDADGRYAVVVATAGIEGTLTTTASTPVAPVTLLPASLRDNDSAGRPVDLQKFVAVEGICTVENFDPARLSSYLQDDGYGINLFAAETVELTRGHRYAVVGQVLHFNGLTEISPSGAADIVDLGEATPPAPVTLTISELLATPERYEGVLVRIAGVTDPGIGFWGVGQSIPLQDMTSGEATLDIRIQSGSTAEDPPAYPASVAGIFGQFDSTTPFDDGYQLQPRDPGDLEAWEPTAYDTWAAEFGAIGGPRDDPDGDGLPNLLEFALAGDPESAASPGAPALAFDGATVRLTVRPDPAATAVTLAIERSDDLLLWTTEGVTLTTVDGDLTGAVDAAAGVRFLRVRASLTP